MLGYLLLAWAIISAATSHFNLAYDIGVVFVFAAYKFGLQYYLFNAYIKFISPTIAVYSVCMFRLFSGITVKWKFSFLSGYTFYIYLFHIWVYKLLFKYVCFPKNEIMSIVLAVIITFGISFIPAYLYKKLWDFVEQKFQIRDKWYCFMEAVLNRI